MYIDSEELGAKKTDYGNPWGTTVHYLYIKRIIQPRGNLEQREVTIAITRL
jgi:hypothetical protein